MIASNSFRRLYAFVAALIAWGALALQFHLGLGLAVAKGMSVGDGIAIFFSYFTVLTNTLAAIALTAALFGSRRTPPSDVVAAIAGYIAIVGVVYYAALKDLWDPQGWAYIADAGLHYVMPIVFVFYWLLFVPKGELRWRAPLIWLVYPALYLAYALWRGAVTGIYPYHFIDVAKLGAQQTTVNCAVLFMAFLVTGLLVVVIDKALGWLRPAEPAAV